MASMNLLSFSLCSTAKAYKKEETLFFKLEDDFLRIYKSYCMYRIF